MLLEYYNIRDLAIRTLNPVFKLEDMMLKKHQTLTKQYTEENLKKKHCAYLLVGDSHTYGLNQFWKPDTDVVNIGINGETTRGVLERFNDNILNIDADNVIILLGYNDFKFRGVDEALSNFKAIIARFNSKNVYIVSLFPVADKRTIMNRMIARYNTQLQKICSVGSKYHYVDAYSALYNDKLKGITPGLTSDGVHLNKSGYDIYIRILKQDAIKTNESI